MTSATQSVRVRRHLDAAPADVYAVLSDPVQHVVLDGSGMLQHAETTDRLTEVGQVFSMAMNNRWIGDYRTHNHLLEVEPDRLLTWTTARDPNPPAGVRWTWRLTPAGDGTDVEHVYDWSQVTDPAVLARVQFPRVQPAELEATLDRLAAAVS